MFLSDEYTIRPPISVWLSPLPSLLARSNVVQNTVTRKKASGDFKDDVCSRGMVSKKDKSMFKINVYSIMDTALAGIQQNQSATGWLTGLLRLCYSITCSPLVGLVGWFCSLFPCCCCCVAAVVSNSVRPHRWQAAHQAPPSLGFSRQEHFIEILLTYNIV